jgi:hypothetical protein
MENTDLAQERYDHRRNHPVARALGLGLAGLLALFLVGRGVAGPAVVIVTIAVVYARRHWLRRRHTA